MLNSEIIGALNFGIQSGHIPPEFGPSLADAPITLPLLRPSAHTGLDEAASSSEALVANIFYTKLSKPRVVRVRLELDARRKPTFISGGSYLISKESPESLLNQVIDATLQDRENGRAVSELDIAFARELAGGRADSEFFQLGALMSYYAHELAFRYAAEIDFPRAAAKYPGLRSEGVTMSDATYMGIYGYAAVARYEKWLILIEYMKTDAFSKGASVVYRAGSYEYFLPDLGKAFLRVQNRMSFSPAAIQIVTRLRGSDISSLDLEPTEAQLIKEYNIIQSGKHLTELGDLEELRDTLVLKSLDKIVSSEIVKPNDE